MVVAGISGSHNAESVCEKRGIGVLVGSGGVRDRMVAEIKLFDQPPLRHLIGSSASRTSRYAHLDSRMAVRRLLQHMDLSLIR